MDCPISVFRSRPLAGCPAHPGQCRTDSNHGGESDHDWRFQTVFEMFRGLTLFDVRGISPGHIWDIYMLGMRYDQSWLSLGSCIRDWKNW